MPDLRFRQLIFFVQQVITLSINRTHYMLHALFIAITVQNVTSVLSLLVLLQTKY
jgi:hypothetical protein